jgi:bifunctional N-acetylglucosamine-1-phosphate-uridyltransferase/glucosamine-1-phosphate-acetyltransferase GlmU-like protein
MAFGSTLAIVINSVTKTLNRINQDNYGSEYYLRGTTDEYRVKVRHSKEAPQKDGTVNDRHNIEVTHTIFATSSTKQIIRQFYIVGRVPQDDALTALGYLFGGFVDYLDDATVQSDTLTWQS